MPDVTKTASASGYLKNIGDADATFAVYILFGLKSGAKTSIHLNPGVTSSLLTLSPVSSLVYAGDSINANVVVNITSPSAAVKAPAFVSPPVTFENPFVYGASWSGEPGIARRVGLGNLGEFNLSIGDASGMPSWLGPTLVVATLLAVVTLGKRKVQRRRK